MPSGTRDVYLSAASLRAPSGADPYRFCCLNLLSKDPKLPKLPISDLLLPNFRGGLARSPYPR